MGAGIVGASDPEGRQTAPPPRAVWPVCLGTVTLAGVAWLVRHGMKSQRFGILFFMVPVLVGARTGGLAGGLCGTLAGGVLTQLGLQGGRLRWQGDLPMGVLFLVVGGLTAWILERQRRSQVETEQALLSQRKSEALLRAVVEGAPDAIFVKDREGRYILFSSAAAGLLGRPVEEVLGRTDREIFPPALARHFQEEDARVMEGGEPLLLEHILPRGKGGDRSVLITKARIGGDGLSPCLLGISRDITELRMAERRLREQEALLRAVMNSLGSGLAVMDPACRIMLVNPQWTRDVLDLGAPLELALGEGSDYCSAALDCLAPGDSAAVAAGVRAVAGGCLARFGMEFASGGRWFGLDVTPLGGQSGGAVAIHTDITPRKRAEASLRLSEERFHEVLSEVEEWVWEMDPKGIFTYVSPSVERILGYAPEAVVGRLGLTDLLAPGDMLRVRILARRAFMRRSRVRGLETRALRRDGSEILLEISASPIHGPGRSVQGYRGVGRDITALRKGEEEMDQLERELNHLQRMESVGRLAGGVAHDMNNVLAAIMAVTDMVVSRHPGDETLQRNAGTILQAATRGRDLVKGLLEFSRKDLQEPRVLDLNALIRQEAELLEHTTLKRVGIRLELQEPLPPVLGEPVALANALMNLCVNAVDAMPGGGELTLASHSDPDGVLVEVSDTGEGMTPEVAEMALEPFFTTKPTGKGTGLGLSIVYGTMKAHGGYVRIQSEQGRGTRVALRFPPSAADQMGFGGHASEPEEGGRGMIRRHVLVVDDDELIRESLPELLEALGHHVVVADSGPMALETLGGNPEVEVVVLDFNMPGMDGLETLARIRERHPLLPVLLASGNLPERGRQALRQFCHVGLLCKPFSSRELSLALRDLPLSPSGSSGLPS
nr:PAS domain S-box protein [uncultured Holophaga sp.]